MHHEMTELLNGKLELLWVKAETPTEGTGTGTDGNYAYLITVDTLVRSLSGVHAHVFI